MMMLGGFVSAAIAVSASSASANADAPNDPAACRRPAHDRLLPFFGFLLLAGLLGFGIWWNTGARPDARSLRR
jgi:hypothetical protein